MELPEFRTEFGWPGDKGKGDLLIGSIIEGAKTATCGFKADYSAEELTAVLAGEGQLQAASSCDGPVRCVIRVTEVFETPFGDPDPRLVAGEGNGQDIGRFHGYMRRYWNDRFPGTEPAPDEVLVAELFELAALVDMDGTVVPVDADHFAG